MGKKKELVIRTDYKLSKTFYVEDGLEVGLSECNDGCGGIIWFKKKPYCEDEVLVTIPMHIWTEIVNTIYDFSTKIDIIKDKR